MVEGVRLTHPDRVLWPEVEVTKLELARYYVGVAEWMLPHVARRPLAVVRGPRGYARARRFFQKHLAAGMPAGGAQRPHPGRGGRAGPHRESTTSPAWSPWCRWTCSRFTRGERGQTRWSVRTAWSSTSIPDESIAWSVVVDAARAARLRLEHLGLTGASSRPTGGKGLHVVVPLARRHGWTEMKAFSRAVAADLARRLPDAFTINPAKAARRGKIYLDYLRNGRGATAVAAYSARARAGAPVSAPLAWEELEGPVRSGDFTVRTVPERLAALPADPWQDVASVRQSITAPMRASLGLARASAPRAPRSRS